MHKLVPLMQGVADKLISAEEAIDLATVDAASLLEEMITARKEAGLSMVIGAQAQAKVAEAMAALSAARVAMVDAHHEMNDVKLRLGVRTRLTLTDSTVKGEAEERTELRVVGE
jgi:hypothetical protein